MWGATTASYHIFAKCQATHPALILVTPKAAFKTLMAPGLSLPSASLCLPSFASPLSSSPCSSPFQLSPPSSSFNGIRLRWAKDDENSEEGKGVERVRTITTEEINEYVVGLNGKRLMFRLQRSVGNDFKSSKFGRMRKWVIPSNPLFLVSVVDI